jgi:hypothetical protein
VGSLPSTQAKKSRQFPQTVVIKNSDVSVEEPPIVESDRQTKNSKETLPTKNTISSQRKLTQYSHQAPPPTDEELTFRIHAQIASLYKELKVGKNITLQRKKEIQKQIMALFYEQPLGGGKHVDTEGLIAAMLNNGKITQRVADDLYRLYDVLDEVSGIQELELLNRKRVMHFNKILSQYPKRGQAFHMNDFKLYEEPKLKVPTNWKELRDKVRKQEKETRDKTEDQTRKEAQTLRRQQALLLMTDGKSIDNLI